MKKVLFLPLFQMPSGHHQVADALMYEIEKTTENVTCKKIDFLSYWNKHIEKLVESSYLKMIHAFPNMYDWVYRNFMYNQFTNKQVSLLNRIYSLRFEEKMLQLIQEEQPDSIVCTHCFPSAILSRLKQRKAINIPVVNVYTDFFINSIWGGAEIDYHLVNDMQMKQELIQRFAIPASHIFITGIPVNGKIGGKCSSSRKMKKQILVAGGSIGLGKMNDYLQQIKHSSNYHYTVLCGKNEKLYEELKRWNIPHIEPKAFISSREEMNELYARSDALVTKPGGITISEALKLGLPIFIHSSLPGQERINLKRIIDKGLAVMLHEDQGFEEQLSLVLEDKWKRRSLIKRMEDMVNKREKIAYEIIVDIAVKTSLLHVRHV
ncbi:galactosyldiacylglycerol synthase [Priestia endophytica]|nr:galactosyldiacylglycerol synthase [Priestia endophytica]